MATGKRAPNKTTKKRSSGRGKTRRKGGSPLGRVRDGLAGAVTREAVGVFLLAVGLFFSAAFASGRGAFVGDAGSFVTGQLFGRVGLALAPLSALAGLLLLLGRLRGRAVTGAALLLLAGAATFAAALPPRHLLSAGHYPEAGGILGSGLYAGVQWAAGAIGAALAIALLYAIGLSLLTGVSVAAALAALKSASEKVVGLGRGLWDKGERRTGSRAKRSHTDAAKGNETADPLGWDADEVVPAELEKRESESAPTREFEVVLPQREPAQAFSEERELAPGEYTPPPFSMLSLGHGNPEHDAEGTSQRLTLALSDLGVVAHVVRAVVGPRVTRYELRLGSGVKVGKVRNLQQDIAYALAATEVRILAPIRARARWGSKCPIPGRRR